MNRLLFAMSTIDASKMNANEFIFDESLGGNKVSDCIGQLEPTAKYMLDLFKDEELQMIILCSNATVEKIDVINGVEYNAVSYFVSRILEYAQIEFNYQSEKFNKEELFIQDDFSFGKISFKFIPFDEENPMLGISSVVKHIRNDSNEIKHFWIDTHGGFRDTALILNGVISLLEVYGIVPDEILGARFGKEKRIVDQSNAYKIFQFVSGMNEFINYGSADILQEYFKNDDDKAVKELIDVMDIISDGTRLCDPGLYIKGLDALRESLDNKKYDDELILIFEDYIKRDYGGLLSKDRTAIDIIKRCYEKKLYQQALTFIESLMPDFFFEKKIIFYADSDENIIEEIKKKSGKGYLSSQHFVFDQFLFELKDYYENQSDDYRFNAPGKYVLQKDFCAVQLLRNRSNRVLTTGVKNDFTVIDVNRDNNEKIGQIQVFTNVKQAYLDKVAVLLRVHKAIKNCRNLTNHAIDGFRPSIQDIEQGIKWYIKIVNELLSEDVFRDREVNSSGLTNLAGGSANKNKKVESDKTRQKDTLTITEIGGGKNLLRGKLTTGFLGVIPQNFSSGIDKNSYLNKTIEVYVGNLAGQYFSCEPVEPLK